MSKQLYEEALAEVKQLKQIAEDNAKKAIMDEVTPRIKQLIETQLMGVANDDEFTEACGTNEDEFSECGDQQQGTSEPLLYGNTIQQEESSVEETEEDDENQITLSPQAESVLIKLMKTKPTTLKEFKTLVYKLGQSALNLGEKLNESRSISAGDLLEVIKGTYVLLRETVDETPTRISLEETLDSYYKLVLKHQELVEMRQNRRRVSEASLNLKIDGFEDESLSGDVLDALNIEIVPETGDEDEEMSAEDSEGGEGSEDLGGEDEEADLDLDGEEGEEDEGGSEEPGEEEKMESTKLSDNTVVEIDEGMLRREIARMKFLREERTAVAVEKKSVAGKKMTPKVLSSFGGGKSDGDPWLDGEVTTESLEETDLMDDDQMTHETYESNELPVSDEAVIEITDDIDEGDEVNVDEFAKKKPEEATPAMQSNVQSNIPEAHRRLASVLEARSAAATRAKNAKKLMERARRTGNRAVYQKANKIYNEATAAYLRSTKVAKTLSESIKRNTQNSNSSVAAETAALRKQLAETNLFNAKLLYTNKLLQNEALTSRQKVTIIEKLDEACSLREAKLVYESLTRTISSGKDRVNENADRQVLGSASRATRPGSTVSLNEGVETARWAKLAGITR